MTRQAALKAPRILPDLTAKSADFARKLGEVLDPVVWYHLSRRYPDGVRIAEIADWHQLLFCEAVDIVKAAEAAGHMKARRAPDGSIRFVWLTGTMPPLSSLENLILRRAQQDLFEGTQEPDPLAVSTDLGIGPNALQKALNFLIFADLLTRNDEVYALTELGRTEGYAP